MEKNLSLQFLGLALFWKSIKQSSSHNSDSVDFCKVEKIKQKPLKMKAILALLLIAVIVAVATAQYVGYGRYYGGYGGYPYARFVPQEKNWNNKKLVNLIFFYYDRVGYGYGGYAAPLAYGGYGGYGLGYGRAFYG